MMTRLITGGVIVNALGLAAFLAAWVYSQTLLPAASGLYVTELDRAGVFSEEHLRKYDAILAENIRANVGPFIAQDHQEAVVWTAVLGAGVSAVNMLLLIGLRRWVCAGEAGRVLEPDRAEQPAED